MAKRRRYVKILSGCLGVVVVLIGSCASLAYLAYRNANLSASPIIDAVFAAIADNTFADKYHEVLNRYARSPTPKEECAAVGELISERLGNLKSKSLASCQTRWETGVSLMDVAYNGKFEKGEGTILATLRKNGSTWELAGFRVMSPLFEQDVATVKCPKCARHHAASAKFCPTCGAKTAIDATEADPQGDPSPEQQETEPGVGADSR
jgi:hypothetical protein